MDAPTIDTVGGGPPPAIDDDVGVEGEERVESEVRVDELDRGEVS